MISFSRADYSIGFPLGDLKGQLMTHTNLHIHFVHRPVWYTLVILEDRNLPHPH